jgi:hypothetical protein
MIHNLIEYNFIHIRVYLSRAIFFHFVFRFRFRLDGHPGSHCQVKFRLTPVRPFPNDILKLYDTRDVVVVAHSIS